MLPDRQGGSRTASTGAVSLNKFGNQRLRSQFPQGLRRFRPAFQCRAPRPRRIEIAARRLPSSASPPRCDSTFSLYCPTMTDQRPPDLPKPKRPKRQRFQKERPPDPESVAATWRLFLAVPLPPPVISLVRDLVADLSTTGWPVRWVSPE